MFEDMHDMLRPLLVRLAVLPGIFSKTQGLAVLSDLDKRQDILDELEFNLDNLAKTSLLLRESLDVFHVQGVRKQRPEAYYSMHPLVRCLCIMQAEGDEDMKRAFQAGLQAFIRGCFTLLKVLVFLLS